MNFRVALVKHIVINSYPKNGWIFHDSGKLDVYFIFMYSFNVLSVAYWFPVSWNYIPLY